MPEGDNEQSQTPTEPTTPNTPGEQGGETQGGATANEPTPWIMPEGGAIGVGLMGMRRLIMRNASVAYTEGGFDLPIRGFEPVCIVGAMAEGGVDAYYNSTTRKIQFYRGGTEVTGTITDVTLIIVGE